MTQPLAIPADEMRVVRVFRLDMPPAQARFLREPGAVANLLGLDRLDDSGIDILRVADLDGPGLAGYLSEGCGVPEEEVARESAALAAATGHIMVLHSRAFEGRAMEIALPPSVRPLASFGIAPTDWTPRIRIETDSARPGSAPRIAPRAARARAQRVGATIFAVFMVLIALLVVALIR